MDSTTFIYIFMHLYIHIYDGTVIIKGKEAINMRESWGTAWEEVKGGDMGWVKRKKGKQGSDVIRY